MEEIYIRKLYPHDITHEVSVTSSIVRNFFDSKTRMIPFYREDGIVRYYVDINSATDPRFGGDFKSMYAAELLDADDYLLFLKRPNGYYLYVLRQGDANYEWVDELFDSRRHLVVSIRNSISDLRKGSFFSELQKGVKFPLAFRRDGKY